MKYSNHQRMAIRMMKNDLPKLIDDKLSKIDSEEFHMLCGMMKKILKLLLKLKITPTVAILTRLEMIIKTAHDEELSFEINEYIKVLKGHEDFASIKNNLFEK